MSFTLQGALKNGFERLSLRATCPNHASFRSPNSCQKRFLWIHKGDDLAPHLFVGLVLEVRDAEKFPQALGFEGLDPFLRVSKHGPCFTATEEDRGDERLDLTSRLS